MGGGRGCGQNICYLVAILCDSNKYDMQHDHVLKKLYFDQLTPFPGLGGSWDWGLQTKYLVPCSCNRDSLKFDMQHDHHLKRWILTY